MTNHGANHGYYAEFDRQINDHPDERKERVVPAMPFVGFTTTVSSPHGDIDTMQFKTHWSLRFRVFMGLVG